MNLQFALKYHKKQKNNLKSNNKHETFMVLKMVLNIVLKMILNVSVPFYSLYAIIVPQDFQNL